MNSTRFDHLSRLVASGSRRDIIRALFTTVLAARLTSPHLASAQLEGIVVLGAACSHTSECAQREMQLGAICADNGFASDGPLNCCLEEGCCQSDAQCCGDRRCAPTSDVCATCRFPPFPTRQVGQQCATDGECMPVAGAEVACVTERCACLSGDQCAFFSTLPVPDIPEADTALAVAEHIAQLEAESRFNELYGLMHPHAQAIIPREAVVGWYREDFTPPLEPAQPIKLRFITWTWDVTGQTYFGAAEVVMRQRNADGTMVGEEIRLMTDGDGEWRWFFGRDRAFVNEQIERFAGDG
ncbi:MAG: hypothetical protein ACRDJC_13585 [Thermomicrobiales bacterium]